VIVVKKMNAEGTKVIDEGKLVYDGHQSDPTIEGPKIHKRNGYYYILAPAGGVSTGWQLALRSKNIYGPYERHVSMHQGKSIINGPHQGAWVTTQTGEDWFLHFQDKKAYGRVVHLNPMTWKNNWPVIGIDTDGDGTGEPVITHKKPNTGKSYPVQTPADSDEFNTSILGKQWQWMANPKATWHFMNPSSGALRLYSAKLPDSAINLWEAPNVLLQKFPAEEFMVTTKMTFHRNVNLENEKAGLAVMGLSYSNIAFKSRKDGVYLVYATCKDAGRRNVENEKVILKLSDSTAYFRVIVSKNAVCTFSYSTNGSDFTEINETFQAEAGRWTGATTGIFCTRQTQTNDAGWVDVDWFRIDAIK
jgi:beta-xylosidase